jgi:hypothetical protein
MPRRNRRMRGGFLNSLESTLNGWGSQLSQSAYTAYNKTKNAVTGSSSEPGALSTTGGKTRRNKRGGSFSANKSVTGLAANSASVSNLKTAQPHNIVGGNSLSASKPVPSTATHSASVSTTKMPQPHKTVGGRSKRHRKHKHSKSCKR